jgi:hypothetical protein
MLVYHQCYYSYCFRFYGNISAAKAETFNSEEQKEKQEDKEENNDDENDEDIPLEFEVPIPFP